MLFFFYFWISCRNATQNKSLRIRNLSISMRLCSFSCCNICNKIAFSCISIATNLQLYINRSLSFLVLAVRLQQQKLMPRINVKSYYFGFIIGLLRKITFSAHDNLSAHLECICLQSILKFVCTKLK